MASSEPVRGSGSITFSNGQTYPVTKPDKWPTRDPILRLYSLPELDSAGYLNLPDAHIEDIRPYALAAGERDDGSSSSSSDDSLRAPSFESSSGSSDISTWEDTLHPVLRYDRWILSKEDFVSLRPALQLVSCILEEPSITPFFIGLRQDPLPTLENEEAKALFGGQQLYKFEPHINQDPEIYRADQIKIWKFLAKDMGKLVNWRFGRNSNSSYATTSVLTTVPGPIPGKTYGSMISLDNLYLRAIKGEATDEEMPWREDLDTQSMRLRTQFHLASAMLHELAHAVGYATMRRTVKEYQTWNPRPAEPFFQDQRITELGFALTQFIFGGIPVPNGPPKELWCHYGLHMRDFPGPLNMKPRGDKVFQYKTPEDVGVKEDWHYAVTMAYVQKMFTAKFWDHDLRQGDPNSLLRYQRTDYRAWIIKSPPKDTAGESDSRSWSRWMVGSLRDYCARLFQVSR